MGMEKIYAAIRKTILEAQRDAGHQEELSPQQSTNAKVVARELAQVREQACVQSLFFKELKDREDGISNAEVHTFEWVFSRASRGQKSWSDFGNWLERGKGVYWYMFQLHI